MFTILSNDVLLDIDSVCLLVHLLELLYNGFLLLLVTVTEHTGVHPIDQSIDR